MLEHRFVGPPFTIGVEEELMLVDAETLDLGQGIEAILEGIPEDVTGHVKPELFQSVLEVATTPCQSVAETTAQLRDLRRTVGEIAERNGYLVGAAGTATAARGRSCSARGAPGCR